MFKINQQTIAGFQMTFDNGWTVSVQWGGGTYSENHYSDFRSGVDSPNAEIAAWDKDGNWHSFGEDNVKGWQTADQVADFIQYIKGL